ncbi:hypothetical protein ACNKHV_00375 [Shigella flexneri]
MRKSKLKAAWRKVATIYYFYSLPIAGRISKSGTGKRWSPATLVDLAEEQYQQLWIPAYGLLPVGTMPAP